MNKGLTLIEVIISLAILGIVITPLMSMFVLSAKINSESSVNYKALLTAQRYIEEIKVMDEIITDDFNYNLNTGAYEKIVPQTDRELGAEIRIRLERMYLYAIEVFVFNNGEIIYSLSGSKIVN